MNRTIFNYIFLRLILIGAIVFFIGAFMFFSCNANLTVFFRLVDQLRMAFYILIIAAMANSIYILQRKLHINHVEELFQKTLAYVLSLVLLICAAAEVVVYLKRQ